MRIPLGRRLRRVIRKQPVPVLLYHSIADSGFDPWDLTVSQSNFRQHAGVLAKFAAPVRLKSLMEGMRHHSLPSNCVAVTFDDGYANNLHVAEPILRAHGIPATFFVTTGPIQHGGEFWWDELGLLVPHDEYSSMYQTLRGESETGRMRRMAKLRTARDMVRDSHRVLTKDELIQLAASPIADLGAHSVSHVSLASVPEPKQKDEILASKAWLERETGRSIDCFSYPFGNAADYTSSTVSLVRQAGYTIACTNRGGFASASSDRFQLPRQIVRNWSSDTFERKLRGWLEGHA